MEESIELDPNLGVADRRKHYFRDPASNFSTLLISLKSPDKIFVSLHTSIVNKINKRIEEVDKAVKADSKQIGEQ